MQQTVWSVHKEMENIGVMEFVNGTLQMTNVNSNKVLINKNNKNQCICMICREVLDNVVHFSKEHRSVLYEMNFYCLKFWNTLTFFSGYT